MTHCQHCGSKLLKNAKFCHNCGEAVVLKMEACQTCNTLNPINAIYCIGCGESLSSNAKGKSQQHNQKNNQKNNQKSGQKDTRKNQSEASTEDKKLDKDTYIYKPIYTITITEPSEMQEETKSYFFQALRTTVQAISDEKLYSKYVQVFYDSGFNFYFSQRQRQLIKDLQLIPRLYPNDIDYQIDLLVDNTFEALLDRFITTHTRELNNWQPPDVTRWELVKKEDLDVEKMISDYLDIADDDSKHYINFISVPLPKLKNAHKSFLFAEKTERLLVLSDQTIFGSCKEGYAITNKGLYWKAFFNTPNRYFFEEFYDIRKEQDWININGQYFHVNPKMNYKLLKLLKKLRAVYGSPSLN